MRFGRLPAAILCASVLIISGCQKQEQAAAQPGPPPSAVGVVTVAPEDLPIINELPGRIAPTRLAEVRPRISGIIIQRVFEQGSQVSQGDVLYRIDPAPFQVQVDSAAATLRRAEAAQLLARQTAKRQEQLRKSNVSSQQSYDTANGELAQADAEVAVAQAGLSAARLNLQYTNVTAPISGRIGRALITEGALVSATGTESLAAIQQLDPIYADFTQPATDLIRLRKAIEASGSATEKATEAKVHLLFDDGGYYPETGRLLFSEAAVDETTGQVTLRGEFPNPDGDLLPGMYVRVQIEQGLERGALAVPQQAVQRDAGGHSNVLVVGAEDKVELRTVVVGRTIGERYVVESGLQPGDRVIAEGFQKTGPGATVKPEPFVAVNAAADPAKPAIVGPATADSKGQPEAFAPPASDASPAVATAAPATDTSKTAN